MKKIAEDVFNESKQAIRGLARRPRTTALVVATFGVAVGASTAMFSVISGVLLRPLPYPNPDAVVSIYTANPGLAEHPTMKDAADRGRLSYPEFKLLQENSKGVLAGIALLQSYPTLVYGLAEPRPVTLGVTSPDLFRRVLQVSPLVGRVFTQDDQQTGLRAAVVAESFWRRELSSDPQVLGETLQIDDHRVEIIGVVPDAARIADVDADVWILSEPHDQWGRHSATAIGRLVEGVTAAQAAGRLTAVLRTALPTDHSLHGVNVFPRQAEETRSARAPLRLLMMASILLLLVASANVAVLLIGSTIDRGRELAVRVALGASRRRLTRQFLVEGLLLGLFAAAAGLAFARLALDSLTLLAPADIPRIEHVALEGTSLFFATGLAIACSLLFGLVPALKLARALPAESRALTGSAAPPGRSGLQRSFVVSEVALSTVMMVGATLLARTAVNLGTVDPGFQTASVLAATVAPPAGLISDPGSDEAERAALAVLLAEVKQAIDALPGVSGVALTSNLPLSSGRASGEVLIEGSQRAVLAERRFVSADYFEVLEIPVTAGRPFEPADDFPPATDHVIISEGLARLLENSAVGRRLEYATGRKAVIIGVVPDLRDENLQQETRFAYYLPLGAAPEPPGNLLINTSADVSGMIGAVRQSVRTVRDGIGILSLRPLTDHAAAEIASETYRARLAAIFAILGVILAMIGLYGVTARAVTARWYEMSVRIALGARPRSVVYLVLRGSMLTAAVGAVAGLAIALAFSEAMRAYVWGVAPTDPLTFLLIAATMGLASFFAAISPALRAGRADPIRALRGR